MPDAKDPNLYELLQVDPKADDKAIRYAYRVLAAQLYPDNAETGDAEAFERITAAWKVLSDRTGARHTIGSWRKRDSE